jgi:hypothetical protein
MNTNMDYISHFLGADVANVSFNFSKIPSSIEKFNDVNGALALHYCIDALLFNQANGQYFCSLLGGSRTFQYAFAPSDAFGDNGLFFDIIATNTKFADGIYSALMLILKNVDFKSVTYFSANSIEVLASAIENWTCSSETQKPDVANIQTITWNESKSQVLKA